MPKIQDGYIAVVYPDGRHCCAVTESHASAMLRARLAHAQGSGRRIRSIQLEEGPTRPVAGTRYSHCHAVSETFIDDEGRKRNRSPYDINPQGVWTLKRIDEWQKPLYGSVLQSVTV